MKFPILAKTFSLLQFTATIQRFDSNGEKSGWTYINIGKALAQQLVPGNKKGFRVKGFLDAYPVEGISLIPMGGGDFILTLNAALRKSIRKGKGDVLQVKLQVDPKPVTPPPELIECLADDPEALAAFEALAKSHQNYFTRWINEAKTGTTKTKRLALTINALQLGQDFGAMIRNISRERKAIHGLKDT